MNENEISRLVESVMGSLNSPSGCTEKHHKCTCLRDISLDMAKSLASKIEAKAKEIGVNAVVAISNTGARPVLIECMDDSYIASYDVALNKAYTVVSLKMTTSQLKELSQPGGPLYGIQFTNNGQIVIFGGGEPLKYNGRIIGGLGVSGGSEEQDTYLASYGASCLAEVIKEFS